LDAAQKIFQLAADLLLKKSPFHLDSGIPHGFDAWPRNVCILVNQRIGVSDPKKYPFDAGLDDGSGAGRSFTPMRARFQSYIDIRAARLLSSFFEGLHFRVVRSVSLGVAHAHEFVSPGNHGSHKGIGRAESTGFFGFPHGPAHKGEDSLFGRGLPH